MTRSTRTKLLLLVGLLVMASGLGLSVTMANAAPTQEQYEKVVKQLQKERKINHRDESLLKIQLRQKYKSDAMEAIRFAATVTGGRVAQGVALVRCETGNTFSPFARNPQSLGAPDVHATGIAQWLYDEEPGNGISRASSWHNLMGGRWGSFNIFNPYVQMVASYQLAQASGGWYNAWKDICGTLADRA